MRIPIIIAGGKFTAAIFAGMENTWGSADLRARRRSAVGAHCSFSSS
ncbi:hypothetical protein [Alicyclobacillus acidocaldarius]|nr:hypothetical protein [Alicyclobacillus acidocaldarius]